VIRVLLADDNSFVRNALVQLFTASGGMQVVAACADGDEVVEAAERTRPDVVLLDLTMARVGGLEAARRLLAVQPDARIVFLTATSSAAAIRDARDLGAVGYVLKDIDPEDLCRLVKRVAAGGTAWGTESETDLFDVTEKLLADTFGDDATRRSSRQWGLWS
jgi:DNA-binding NarL/FixJ family response regulator